MDGVTSAYVYDTSTDAPLAHDDILLEFSGDTLTRRWLHSDSVEEAVGFEEYGTTSGVGSGAERSIYADRQGSVIHVADTVTGTVVASYEYDSYGQLTQTQGDLTQPYAYTGHEYEPQSSILIRHVGSWSRLKFQLGF